MATAVPDWITEALAYDKPLHPALEPWVFQTPTMGPMVKHPFVFSTIGDDRPPMLVKKANEIYDAKRKLRREFLDERHWWRYLFLLVERPYRMGFLEKLHLRNRISDAEFRELLPEVWTDTEAPQVNQDEPMRLFRAAGFVTDNSEGWDEISKDTEELVLYRGVDGHLELTKDGPSWTLSRKTAEFFAYRWGAKGKVYTYTAHPDEALAYFTSRDEAEIILDFDKTHGGLSNKSKIRLVPKT